jgi:hypothetical protein
MAFDSGLFVRAEEARRTTSIFLDDSKGVLVSHKAAISDRYLQDAARSEAKRAVEAGLGTMVLSGNELTAGMNRLCPELSKPYEDWKAEADKHKVAIDSAIAGLEQEADDVQHHVIPDLRAAKASELARVNRDFEMSSAYSQNREKHKAAKDRFERLRMYNNNAFPKPIAGYVYWPLLLILGVGDCLVNYFVLITKFELVVALVITLLIAVVVAAASHVHGKYLKQRNLLFSLEIFESDRRDRRRRVFWMAFAFIIVLAFVFWARYSYFAAGASVDWSSDALFDPAFVMSKVGPTLFLNILIWFVGVVWSFIAHEKVPGITEAFKQWKEADAELDEMRSSLAGKKQEIERTYENELLAAANRLNECRTRLSGLKSVLGQLSSLAEGYASQVSASGNGILRQYASFLCAELMRLEKDASAIVFVSQRRGRLSIPEFEASDFQFGV